MAILRLFPLLALLASSGWSDNLTGLWYGPPAPNEANRRDLWLAIRVQGARVRGEVESPTRNAPLVEGRLTPQGFKGIAQSDWDGKLARRPVEGRLEGSVLHLSIQAWPDGPTAHYTMERKSVNPAIPKVAPVAPPPVKDLDWNGLAKTPPMGWNSWNKFGCRINDAMIREMADALISSGMKQAGYEFLNIDDCWQGERDAEGNIRSDARRFPDMKALADYVHGKGLKLGIYSSPGPRTCAGFEGSYGHEERDARTWASWGIDLLKYDWCSAGKLYKPEQMRAVYQKMGAALAASGRPIVYSICQYGLADVWTWAPKAGGNMWRITGDIGDNWKSMEEIGFEHHGDLARFAGPGHWNDPDMLEVGNGGMSTDEYQTHMSLWALLAAPLLAGNDIRNMNPETRSILMNPDLIEVDQDPVGQAARRRWKNGQAEIWSRALRDGSMVVGAFNRGTQPQSIEASWADAGLSGTPVRIQDLWQHKGVPVKPSFSALVPPHGVVLIRTWTE